MNACGFVGAMLAPHHRENSKLDEIGLSVKQALDASIFLCGKPVLTHDLRRDLGRVLHESVSTRLANSAFPSVPPRSGSITRSGWGIRPRTFRFSLIIPAILRAEPFGFSPSA